MKIIFVHPSFPAQFKYIAQFLSDQGWEVTFVTSIDTNNLPVSYQRISYHLGANMEPLKSFQNPSDIVGTLEHLGSVYRGLKSLPELQPDIVVGHISYGTLLYLRTLYDCPFVGFYEFLPADFWSADFDLRPDYPATENARISNATYHALTYLHLHACDAVYTPTHFQKSTAPAELQNKFSVVFDGVDTAFFSPLGYSKPLVFHGVEISDNTKIITYVSRGLESIRGFDIFMKAVKLVCEKFDDVAVIVAGEERTVYGHEMSHITENNFLEHVLAKDNYDLNKIHFVGRVSLEDLVKLYRISQVHVYLTVDYVLSWSLVQAMSTGCKIVSCNSAPVTEVIDHEMTGLLADFYDFEAIAEHVAHILEQPEKYSDLGLAARQKILENYSLEECAMAMTDLFEKQIENYA